MKIENLINRLKSSSKKQLCDLVIKNISIIDVFQSETFIADVAITDGYIVGIGIYEGKEIIDGTNKYICPGLIDAHSHLESSLVTPKEYYKAALKHGITSLITDPHEIANVLGAYGINLMIELNKNIPFDIYFMLPSCVPSTNFENGGAILNSKDLSPFYNFKEVIGLAEVMNFPAVLNFDEDMLNKILDSKNKNLVVDGHGAGFDETMLNTYITAGISTDHECHNTEEVIDRLRRGMYVLMREGTVAKNLTELIKAASISNSRRICFCTDDKHIDDLIKNGSIDQSIKIAINSGLRPETAIQMSTLNTAECYKLKDKGAIAPGFIADFIILDNLESFRINSVYKNGNLVVKDNELINIDNQSTNIFDIKKSVFLPTLNNHSFKIDVIGKNILNVIELIEGRLETNHLKLNISDLNLKDEFNSIIEKDLLKVAVIERHHMTNNIGLGVIRGLNLKEGAIATTIAHDSHNLIVCGCNDEDMLFAVSELEKMNGGIIVVKNKKVIASIELEIGGLITSRASLDVIHDLEKLHNAISEIAPDIDFNPFLTLSFLSLPVIPTLKITDKGLFDLSNFEFIDVVQ